MESNPVIQTILDHKSIRKFTDKLPSDEVIETIFKSGQQAPFASQCYSLLLSRNRSRNPMKAPLLFTIARALESIEGVKRALLDFYG